MADYITVIEEDRQDGLVAELWVRPGVEFWPCLENIGFLDHAASLGHVVPGVGAPPRVAIDAAADSRSTAVVLRAASANWPLGLL